MEPNTTVDPLSAIMPMYDPCACRSSAPAAGSPANDLRHDESISISGEHGAGAQGKVTHGKDRMLYSIPMRMPISLMSEICAMHGTTSALNAPLKKPYTAA